MKSGTARIGNRLVAVFNIGFEIPFICRLLFLFLLYHTKSNLYATEADDPPSLGMKTG